MATFTISKIKGKVDRPNLQIKPTKKRKKVPEPRLGFAGKKKK